MSKARELLARVRATVRSALPKALHLLAIVGGWALLTQGVSAWCARPDVVWPMSGGLLLLSAAGWGHLRVIGSAGVYALSRRARLDRAA